MTGKPHTTKPHSPAIGLVWLFIRVVVLLSVAALPAPAIADGFKLLRSEGGFIHYYKGSATLRGTVKRFTDEATIDLVGDHICFTATGDSAKLIPRLKDDQRTPWFCFSDFSRAIKLLKLPAHPQPGTCGYEAEAIVVIKNYIEDMRETEAFDTAALVSAPSRGQIRAIPCE